MNDRAWPDLEAFLAVMEAGSLATAAEALGTSAPTLGRRIARLEAQAGAELFAKDTKGYRPTPAAEALLPAARAVRVSVMAALRVMDGLATEVAGTVQVACPETVVTHLLLPRLGALRRRHPGLTVEFVAGPGMVDLPQRAADLAVRLNAPGEDSLYARRIGEQAFAAYAPRGFPGERDPGALPWVGWPDAFAEMPAARLAAGLFEPSRKVAAANSLPIQCAMALELGAALVLPTFMGDGDGRLERVGAVAAVLPVWLVTTAETRASGRIKAVGEWIAGAFADP